MKPKQTVNQSQSEWIEAKYLYFSFFILWHIKRIQTGQFRPHRIWTKSKHKPKYKKKKEKKYSNQFRRCLQYLVLILRNEATTEENRSMSNRCEFIEKKSNKCRQKQIPNQTFFKYFACLIFLLLFHVIFRVGIENETKTKKFYAKVSFNAGRMVVDETKEKLKTKIKQKM